MSLRFFSHLQGKLILGFLLVSVVPLAVVGIVAVGTADDVITSIVTNQLQNVAREKGELLERWIAERTSDLEVVARSSITRSMDPNAIAPYLALVREQYGVYPRFVVFDKDGSVVCESAAEPDHAASERRFATPDPALLERARAGERAMSGISLEPGGHDSVFHLSSPVRGPDGGPLGAVSATVSTRAILARVLSVSLGTTGECYLVDKSGTFLAHNEPRRILKETIAQSESFASIFEARRPSPVYTDYRGIRVLGASDRVGGTEWYVVVEQDRDEAFAASDRLRRDILSAIGLTLAVAIGLSSFLAVSIARPIRALSAGARSVAEGRYEGAVPAGAVARRDEIGALAASFADMARQLKERHAMLENRVGEREAELREADSKLRKVVETAERAEHLAALGRLAAGVAHEIRTPLTSLKLFLQSVEGEIEIPPDHEQDFSIAMREVRRIESTINHFLDLARPREPLLTAIDFGTLVEDALVVVAPRAHQQEVEVSTRVAPSLAPVNGDMRQLGEVLVNLLANALEAMPAGGRIAVAVDAEDPSPAAPGERPWVRIEVSDTGAGIRDEDLGRLFEPFFTTKESGSGLGLAIARSTVERHGGTISVATKLGAGTTFTIRLPGLAAGAEQGKSRDGWTGSSS